jgi:osmotically-inducible protein OsmY
MPQSWLLTPLLILSILLGVLCLPAAAVGAQPDAAARAQTLIDVNPLLSGYGIRVVGGDGPLRLEGSVADVSDRDLAAALAALVADGADIDNALDLEAAVPKARGRLFGADEDLTTTARLRQTLKWQTDTAGLDIDVDVDGGAVHLKGNVGTTAEKDRVVALAATTEGVDRVFSYISVDPDLIPAIRDRHAELARVHHSDSWIGSRLLRLLRFDTTVNAHSLEIEALEGKVILSGTVTSSAERSVAETLARRVPGVTAVDSRLIIERPR